MLLAARGIVTVPSPQPAPNLFHENFYNVAANTGILNLESRMDPEDEPLRPCRFEDFVGQRQTRENLQLFVQAAAHRREPLDHTLLYGPPGLGKTTLALLIAGEMGVNVKMTTGRSSSARTSWPPC